MTLLLAALSAQTPAPRAAEPGAWALAQLRVASTPLERFPAAERSAAFSLLKPYLGPLFQGDSSGQLNQAMRSFRGERITLAGNPALVVQPTGSDLCGGTGNCSFWIIDARHRRVVLNADGIQSFALSPTQPGGMPYIITSTHSSSFEQERIRWQFQGSSYRRADCATVDTANETGQPYATPRITPHPCPIEGT